MADALRDSSDLSQPGRRPMIALLKAKLGMEDRLRNLLIVLVRETKREPGCLEFVLYEVLKEPGHFYLYEIYQNNAAFSKHLKSEAVARFKEGLESVSDSNQAKDLTQLIEVLVE